MICSWDTDMENIQIGFFLIHTFIQCLTILLFRLCFKKRLFVSVLIKKERTQDPYLNHAILKVFVLHGALFVAILE